MPQPKQIESKYSIDKRNTDLSNTANLNGEKQVKEMKENGTKERRNIDLKETQHDEGWKKRIRKLKTKWGEKIDGMLPIKERGIG